MFFPRVQDQGCTTGIEGAHLAAEIDLALGGSLFSRQLATQEESVQSMMRGFLVARASYMWAHTTMPQRKGYHVAGVGLRAGQFLDANIKTLVDLLVLAEAGLAIGDSHRAVEAIVEFSKIVFQTTPFRMFEGMPAGWERALAIWIEGRPILDVRNLEIKDHIELLQDAFSYRLPWAMEAVRVHALAIGLEGVEAIYGYAAMAVEAGSTNQTVITLLRSGLHSREAATTVVAQTKASFTDHLGMLEWLNSGQIEILTKTDNWPTPLSRHAWLRFYHNKMSGNSLNWTRESQVFPVAWHHHAPAVGTSVVIEPNAGLVLTPDLIVLGNLKLALERHRRGIVSARVGTEANTVVAEFFEPSAD